MTPSACPMCAGPLVRDRPDLLTLDAVCLACEWFVSTRPVKTGQGALAANSRRYAVHGPTTIGPVYMPASLKNPDARPLFHESWRPAITEADHVEG